MDEKLHPLPAPLPLTPQRRQKGQVPHAHKLPSAKVDAFSAWEYTHIGLAPSLIASPMAQRNGDLQAMGTAPLIGQGLSKPHEAHPQRLGGQRGQ